MDVQMPDGTIITGVPEGTTKAQLMQKLRARQDSTTAGLVGKVGQGLTFGLADELQAGLFAAPRALGNLIAGKEDASIGSAYNQLLSEQRANLDAASEQYPLASLGLEVAGGLGTGLAGAATKGGRALTQALTTGSLPARIAKGAGLGSASAGAYGFGTGEGGLEQRGSNAGESALYGGAIGGAIPAAGAVVKSTAKNISRSVKGFKARDAEALDNAALAISQESSQNYQKMRDVGAVINRNKGVNIANRIEKSISESPLNKRLHGDTLSVLNDFKARAAKGNLGLEELDQYRQLFSQAVTKNTELGGKINPDARLAAKAIDTIDNIVDDLAPIDFKGVSGNAVDALNLGRQTYAKSRRFQTIANIVKKSDGDQNYVRRELKKLVDNPKKIRGFSAPEVAALKEASKLNTTEAIAKVLGTFGFDTARLGSGVGAAFGAGVGGSVGGMTGAAAVPALGTGARYGGKLISRGKVEELLKVIEQRGRVPLEEINKLPPKEAQFILEAMRAANKVSSGGAQ